MFSIGSEEKQEEYLNSLNTFKAAKKKYLEHYRLKKKNLLKVVNCVCP